MAPFCYCKGNPCVCKITFVVYLLRCEHCGDRYVGKTIRQLRVRIMEHLRAIKNGKGSALAKHKCFTNESCGFEIYVLARAEGNLIALSLMEAKMISKYKSKINIRKETRTQALSRMIGKALRNVQALYRMIGNILRNKDSCKGIENTTNYNNDEEDEHGKKYRMEESEDYCVEVEKESADGDGMSPADAEKHWNQSSKSEQQKARFNLQNYELLIRNGVVNNNRPFDILHPSIIIQMYLKSISMTNEITYRLYQSRDAFTFRLPSLPRRRSPIRRPSPLISPQTKEEATDLAATGVGTAVGAATGTALASSGAKAGAAAGLALGPPGAIGGAIVGGFVGYLVGKTVANKINNKKSLSWWWPF